MPKDPLAYADGDTKSACTAQCMCVHTSKFRNPPPPAPDYENDYDQHNTIDLEEHEGKDFCRLIGEVETAEMRGKLIRTRIGHSVIRLSNFHPSIDPSIQ